MGNCIYNLSKEVGDSKSQTDDKNDHNDHKHNYKNDHNDNKHNDKNDHNDETKNVKKVDNVDNVDIYSLCTDENTFCFSYEKLRKKVKILRVIDGDTVDIAMSLVELQEYTQKDIYKYRVRLYGIDTPEKRPPKNDPNRDKEIAASKRSSEALNNYLRENDYIVIAQFYKPDKYGRLLATFYDKNGDDINKWMVFNGYAYEYFGKTKEKFIPDE